MIVKLNNGIPLEDVLYRIEYADHEEIDAMIDAIQRRYRRLFPDWEITFLSMPVGNRKERAEQGKLLMEFIRKKYMID